MFDKLFSRKPAHERTDINRRFNLIARVGQGSMSKVWRATDLQTGRSVAVKVLDKEKTARFEARFQGLNKPSEGEIALALNHPNIVKTYEFGWTMEDEMFLVMEFVEGVGLSLLVDLQNEEMKRYRLRYMIQIGEALMHFHQQGFIHRDVCPRNVMIADEKAVKVIDFGLAVPNTRDFCKPGNRTGTASYLAPELIKRQQTDHRLDVFSFAVTCYEMYTKRFPWEAAMTIDAVLQHINKPPLQISTLVPSIDKQIAAAIMKGLESNPDDRWQTVSAMVAEIRDAEARLVRVAREAAAAKGKPMPSLEPKAERQIGSRSTPSMMPLSSGELSSGTAQPRPAPGKPATGKSVQKKRRSTDDDVDLTELFGD